MTRPVWVSVASPSICAMPKSVSTTRPESVISTLLGLMSRCRMPFSWACRSAPSICRPISATRRWSIGPRSMMSCSDGARTSSITIQGRSDSCTTSWTVTTPEWFSRADARPPERPLVQDGALVVVQARREHDLLDRDLAVKHDVAGAPHGAHAAPPHHRVEPVAVTEQTCLCHVGRVPHWSSHPGGTERVEHILHERLALVPLGRGNRHDDGVRPPVDDHAPVARPGEAGAAGPGELDVCRPVPATSVRVMSPTRWKPFNLPSAMASRSQANQ